MEEIHGIVEIQRNAWQMSELEIVATFEMKAVCDFGIVIIAVNQDEQAIGFIYGFPEFPNYHYSHMMAVIPEWQGRGVGFEMKKFHRALALASPHNIEKIRWTVDPLLPNNAHLNFTKLGGRSSKYYVNYYGDPEEVGIYKGLPTDRILLEWNIREKRVQDRIKNPKTNLSLSRTQIEKHPKLNTIQDLNFVPNDNFVPQQAFLVQVPNDFQKLKRDNMVLAKTWRIIFRNLCIKYFEQDWEISDYFSISNREKRENYYLFTKC